MSDRALQIGDTFWEVEAWRGRDPLDVSGAHCGPWHDRETAIQHAEAEAAWWTDNERRFYSIGVVQYRVSAVDPVGEMAVIECLDRETVTD